MIDHHIRQAVRISRKGAASGGLGFWICSCRQFIHMTQPKRGIPYKNIHFQKE
jgi:hypothetical protein